MAARETLGPGREQVWRMLEQRPETLAGLVTFLETRGLWQYHRKYYLKLTGTDPDAIKRRSPADLWNHLPDDTFSLKDFSQTGGGRPAVKGDYLFTNGEVTRKINVHGALTRLVLRAKASPAKNVYPVMYVKIDGQVVDEYYMDSKGYKNYYTDMKLTPGTHLLGLQYVNDLSVGGNDRNVGIQRVELRHAS